MMEISAEHICKYCKFLWRTSLEDPEHDGKYPVTHYHFADDPFVSKGTGGQDRYLCRHPKRTHINSDVSDRIVGFNDGLDCPFWTQDDEYLEHINESLDDK